MKTYARIRHLRTALKWHWGAVLVMCVVASAVGAFALVRATSSPARTESYGPIGPGGDLTLAQPMRLGGKQESLRDAASALGAPVVLPNSTQVTPADAGTVWVGQMQGGTSGDASTAVAVTFPSQGLLIQYARPPIADPLANYRQFVSQSPGSRVVYLGGGVPALSIPAAPDGSAWTSVGFVAGGTTVIVLGHGSEASVQAVAQSILDRATSTG